MQTKLLSTNRALSESVIFKIPYILTGIFIAKLFDYGTRIRT